MTYQRNIGGAPLLVQQDVLHERAKRLVCPVEEDADDGTGDQDDHRALHDLGPARPLDLLELGDRLADERKTAAARALRGALREDGRGRGLERAAAVARAPGLGRAKPWRPRDAAAGALIAGSATRVAALPAGLARHYRVSRCGVWRPHQRQYLLNSTR